MPNGANFAAWDGVDRGKLDPDQWMSARNDLEAPAISLLPEISDMLDILQQLPEQRLVRMSGSGATCFVLFNTIAARDTARALLAKTHPDWWTMAAALR